MAADHHREAGGFWFKVQLREIVKHVDGNALELEHLCFRQFARPRAFVDIAANRSDRGNFGKFLENLWPTDVSGMNDVIRTAQGSERCRAQQAVGVGDDADQN